jgi:hypothetical protein
MRSVLYLGFMGHLPCQCFSADDSILSLNPYA